MDESTARQFWAAAGEAPDEIADGLGASWIPGWGDGGSAELAQRWADEVEREALLLFCWSWEYLYGSAFESLCRDHDASWNLEAHNLLALHSPRPHGPGWVVRENQIRIPVYGRTDPWSTAPVAWQRTPPTTTTSAHAASAGDPAPGSAAPTSTTTTRGQASAAPTPDLRDRQGRGVSEPILMRFGEGGRPPFHNVYADDDGRLYTVRRGTRAYLRGATGPLRDQDVRTDDSGIIHRTDLTGHPITLAEIKSQKRKTPPTRAETPAPRPKSSPLTRSDDTYIVLGHGKPGLDETFVPDLQIQFYTPHGHSSRGALITDIAQGKMTVALPAPVEPGDTISNYALGPPTPTDILRRAEVIREFPQATVLLVGGPPLQDVTGLCSQPGVCFARQTVNHGRHDAGCTGLFGMKFLGNKLLLPICRGSLPSGIKPSQSMHDTATALIEESIESRTGKRPGSRVEMLQSALTDRETYEALPAYARIHIATYGFQDSELGAMQADYVAREKKTSVTAGLDPHEMRSAVQEFTKSVEAAALTAKTSAQPEKAAAEKELAAKLSTACELATNTATDLLRIITSAQHNDMTRKMRADDSSRTTPPKDPAAEPPATSGGAGLFGRLTSHFRSPPEPPVADGGPLRGIHICKAELRQIIDEENRIQAQVGDTYPADCPPLGAFITLTRAIDTLLRHPHISSAIAKAELREAGLL
ncbi:hypothetical protein OHV05_37415 (plasmid) [Kitasatospora sp. NBC_00070]|uniref:putative adhesin n=1 Tax=Kitasatospora sp. NBC_00070 TaxID=2975962 RepID=UPI002F9143AC